MILINKQVNQNQLNQNQAQNASSANQILARSCDVKINIAPEINEK
jgi:hypothetical protein